MAVLPVLAVVLAALPAPMLAADPVRTQPVKLNVSASGYPPFLLVDGEAPAGIMVDVFRRVAARLGQEVVYLPLTRPEVDAGLEAGTLDATPRAIEWVADPDRYVFSDPVLAIKDVLFVRSDAAEDLFTIGMLAGKRIAAQRGYRYPTLAPLFAEGGVVRVDADGPREQLALLDAGEADFAVMAEPVGYWHMREAGLRGRFKALEPHLESVGYRFLFLQRWRPFVQRFNAELARMRGSGELFAIVDSYR